MKNKRLYILLFVAAVALIFATSCKTTKPTTTTTTVTPPPVVDNHVALNEIKASDFSTLQMNFRTQISDVGVSGQVRIQKNRVIWVSISKLIELARVKLTPDSAYASIKIKNQAFQGTYEQFQKQFGIAINFDIAQAIIIGNDISSYTEGTPTYKVAGNTTTIAFDQRRNPKQSLVVKHSMVVDHSTRKIMRHNMITSSPDQRLNVDYSRFETFGKSTLPQVVDINIYSTESGNVSARLEFSKVQLNQKLTYPISISSRAKPISL